MNAVKEKITGQEEPKSSKAAHARRWAFFKENANLPQLFRISKDLQIDQPLY